LPINIAERLQKFRTAAGLSRSQVADKIGCTTSAICYWESGKRQPDADTLLELINIYNIHISQFFDEKPCDDITEQELKIIMQYRQSSSECKQLIETILNKYTRKE
jgi:transcriptional regulator with XRE-family HTH domain